MNCIVIKSGTATPRIMKRKDGTQVVFKEQSAAIEKGEDFPVPFTINLGDDQPPYPPGRYSLDVSSLEVGDFKSLKVGRRVYLTPAPAPASK
ncbi:single-stranded DNA-binding protein [Luteimonas sp. 22616]|uniref:single-stranded DNA-binding protein n=1 Tax=Luteimonas sp. 22616 TaxID=3453951 RepID=UPI003F864D85